MYSRVRVHEEPGPAKCGDRRCRRPFGCRAGGEQRGRPRCVKPPGVNPKRTKARHAPASALPDPSSGIKEEALKIRRDRMPDGEELAMTTVTA